MARLYRAEHGLQVIPGYINQVVAGRRPEPGPSPGPPGQPYFFLLVQVIQVKIILESFPVKISGLA